MDENNEVIAQTENEHVDGSATENQDSSTQDDKYLSQKKRAEKAEAAKKAAEAEAAGLRAKLAAYESAGEPEARKPEPTQALSREETILYAKGYSEDEVTYAKKVAAVEGVSPLVAAETDLFKSWKKSRDERAKSEAAQLGAAGGSHVSKKGPSISDPNVDDATHEALWKKKMGISR